MLHLATINMRRHLMDPFIIRTCAVLFLFVLQLPAPFMAAAQAPEPLEIAGKLQDTYEKATNLVADFNQVTSMKFSQRIRRGSGSMIFLRPGYMRWDYISPDHQVLISDGVTISMYFEKNNQMIISDAKEYLQSDVTYSFFAGTGNILEDFTVAGPDHGISSEDSLVIKLIPASPHPHVSYIHVWVDSDTFLIEHLQIVDHFETLTDLYFKNVRIDSESYGIQEISKKLFSFVPPADTEVIRQF